MALRKVEGRGFGKVLYVIFVSNTWQLEPHKNRLGRGRQLGKCPMSAYVSDIIYVSASWWFCTQPIEEKLLLLLCSLFAEKIRQELFLHWILFSHLDSVSSDSQNWKPQASVYLSERATAHPGRQEARKRPPKRCLPCHPSKLLLGLFPPPWHRSEGRSDLCGRVQASQPGSEETWGSLDPPSNLGAYSHVVGYSVQEGVSSC